MKNVSKESYFIIKPWKNSNELNIYKQKSINIDKIVDTLSGYCSAVNLRRLDETKEIVEASFLVEFRDFEQLNKAKIALQQLDDSLKFSFLDSKGMY